MRKSLISISIISFGLSACAPLQQAPLLYSSKTTVGLDVSTSTTESPGGSISFGVKIVDAAYVPVAVSKRLRDDAANRDLPADIILVQAVFGEGSTAGKLDSLTEENKAKIRDFLSAKLTEEKLVDEVKRLDSLQATRSASREGARASLKAIETQLAALAAETPEETKKAKEAERGTATRSVESLTALIERDAPVLTAKRNELDVAKANAERLFSAAAEAASVLRTDKKDAMSVYGRFNSESAASAASSASAKLTAGKIFSTGVASQNLTEAVRHEAIGNSLAACLEGLAKLLTGLTPEARAELLRRYDSVCFPATNQSKK